MPPATRREPPATPAPERPPDPTQSDLCRFMVASKPSRNPIILKTQLDRDAYRIVKDLRKLDPRETGKVQNFLVLLNSKLPVGLTQMLPIIGTKEITDDQLRQFFDFEELSNPGHGAEHARPNWSVRAPPLLASPPRVANSAVARGFPKSAPLKRHAHRKRLKTTTMMTFRWILIRNHLRNLIQNQQMMIR